MEAFVKKFNWYVCGVIIILIVLIPVLSFGQYSIRDVGGLESELPSYWTKGSEPDGATLTWATDEYNSLGRSLKISKVATSEAAAWVSENMCDQWTPTHAADKDWLLGAYVMTENVNVNPANDDERWYLKWEFWDSSGVYIGETMVPIDQSVASNGSFMADTNDVGASILPRPSFTTIVSFVGGKDATGTVWVDNFIMADSRGAKWSAIWNNTFICPTGWFYWLPSTDGVISHGYENTRLTTAEAHSGVTSLMFDLPFDRDVHDAFIGAKRVPLDNTVKPGDIVRMSVWIKAKNLVPDSAATDPNGWSCGFTPIFFGSADNNAGFGPNEVGAHDSHFKFPPVTEFDWTEYTADFEVPEGAGAMSARLHPYAKMTGTIYFDDLKVEKLDVPQISNIGGFESDLPSYWTKAVEPSGATLEWATDEYLTLGRSLKISKEVTSEAAVWKSENMCDQWTPTHAADQDWLLGAYVKTQNVNTNPANDDERWYMKWEFWDSSGVFIGETMVPIDQSMASNGAFMADTNDVGASILPRPSFTTIVSFVGGKDATGTVWVDNFIMASSRGAKWSAIWNDTFICPTGWFYWLPSTDGMVSHGYENTRLTSAEAHSGLTSLMFDLPFDRDVHDAFIGAKRVPLTSEENGKTGYWLTENVSPGDIVRLKVWIKATDLVPDSAAADPNGWSCGFTPIFFASADNNAGFGPNELKAYDSHFKFPPVTEFDWTEYTADFKVPEGTGAMSVRLHPYAKITGKIYFDDLTVEKLDVPQISNIGGFESDLPSYWTKGAEPSGATLEWSTSEYMSLGRSLKISKEVTSDAAAWVSENMCDQWTPSHAADKDWLLGAYVKTQNVNTNPANDDERWYLKWEFWDSSGVYIGETMVPIDQSVASNGAFMADTNDVGASILPRPSFTTIVSFVGGKDATGTVWVDNFIMADSRGAKWSAIWNNTFICPTGWFYWLPSTDGVISHGYENTRLTSAEAHSGLTSLMFDLPFDRDVHDAFIGAKRVPFDHSDYTPPGKTSSASTELLKAEPGDIVRISVWIKATDLVPDSAAADPNGWSCGFTPIFFASADNNAGFGPNELKAYDSHFKFPPVTAFDWTEYYTDFEVPEGAGAMSARLHPYAKITGTIYFDDLTIKVIGKASDLGERDNNSPLTFELGNNYPNPFNPTTTIEYSIPDAGRVTLEIFNILGQNMLTLVDENQSTGRYQVVWDGKDKAGSLVGSGIYFYQLRTKNAVTVKKMILLK